MSNLPNLSRRDLLASSLPLLAGAHSAFAKTRRPIGVQLYTVRGTLMKESERIIKAIADIGYKEIEGAGRTDLITLMPLIEKNGMKAVSCHVEVPLVTGDWEVYNLKPVELSEAIESVKKIGVQYFTMAYINPRARG